MIISSLFEWQKKKFFDRKKYFLKIAKEYKDNGDLEPAQEVEKNILELQEESDKLSLHFLSNGSQLKMFFRVWGFWQNLSNLEDSLKSMFRQLVESFFIVGSAAFLIRRFWFGMYIVPTGSAEPNLLVGDRIVGIKYPYIFSAPKRGDLVIIDDPLFVYHTNPILKAYQKYLGLPLFGILPAGPEAWVKRLVGLPGDKIELKTNESNAPEVWLDSKLLNEPSLNPFPVIHLTRKRGFLRKTNVVNQLPVVSNIISFFGLVEDFNVMSMLYTFDPSKAYDDQPFYNFDSKEVTLNKYTKKPIILYPNQAEKKDKIQEFIVPEGHLFLLGDNRRNSGDSRNFGMVSTNFVLGRASFIFWSLDGVESWWFVEFLKDPIKFFTKKIRYNQILDRYIRLKKFLKINNKNDNSGIE